MKVGSLYSLKDCKNFIVLIISFETTNYNMPMSFVQYYRFSSKTLYTCHGSFVFNQYYDFYVNDR
jgi:hypothetical protein